MLKLYADITALGGLASMNELLFAGHWRELIEIGVQYRKLIRVRKGWYCLAGEDASVVQAWRVGGRLTCLSAIAYHSGQEAPRDLHVEVPANTARLHSPHDRRRLLHPTEHVVVHWARVRSAGNQRAVSAVAAPATVRPSCRQPQVPPGDVTTGTATYDQWPPLA